MRRERDRRRKAQLAGHVAPRDIEQLVDRPPAGVEGLSSFGEDARGRVYVTSLNGKVYRFAQ